MTSKPSNFLELSKRGDALLHRARTVLQSGGSATLQGLAARVPKNLAPDDEPVRIVFAGQYSSGKSMILRALTGREDIVSGAGITTQEAHRYEWNGVRVVDTPGIHTKLRPDHDEISYREIASADLLVFVVTNELFDSHLGQHFRKLAIERDKVHEMMLVVNKMDREAEGNTLTAHSEKLSDLRKMLAPFSPDDLRTTFVAAEDFVKSKTAKASLAAALRKRSGFEHFEEVFERFVAEQGVLGKWSTAVYELEQVLQEALAAESSGDEDAEGVEEMLLQKRRALVEAQRRIPESVETPIQTVASKVKSEGRAVAEMVQATADAKQVNESLAAAQKRVEQYASELAGMVEDAIGQEIVDLDKKFQAIANSELAKELMPRLSARVESAVKEANINPETIRKIGGAAKASSELGQFLIKSSFNPTATTLGGLFKLNQYSGTAAHDFVKALGGFMGKRFMPWEAVKWTRFIANAGRVLSLVGAVLSIALQIKEDIDAAQRDKDLRESRSAIRTGFNDAAHEIEVHYDTATGQFVSKMIAPEIVVVDKQLAELRSVLVTKSTLFEELSTLLTETQDFIRDLHAKNAIPES